MVQGMEWAELKKYNGLRHYLTGEWHAHCHRVMDWYIYSHNFAFEVEGNK